MWPLIAVGGVIFWTICIVELLILFALIEDECFGWSTISVGVLILIFCLLSEFNVFMIIWENPLSILKYVIYYLVIGVVYSVLRWYVKNSRYNQHYCKEKKIWLKDHPGKTEEDWLEYTTFRIPDFDVKFSTLVGWTAYWPVSFIWMLCRDFIKRGIEQIIYSLKFLYEWVARLAMKEVLNDKARYDAIQEQRMKEARQKNQEMEENRKKQNS